MLISEVARAAGLPKDTVRYYTKLGLIHANDKAAGSRVYADYDESVLEILSDIKLAKSSGFTLNEIKAWMGEWNQGNLASEDVVRIFSDKLKEIRRRKKELTKTELLLREKIEKLSA